MKQSLLYSLLIVVSFLLNFSTSIAQIQKDTTKVSFVAYWAKGDAYNYRITKIKKEWEQDKLTINDSSQYIARFEVLDSTETSYTIKWSYKNKLKEVYNLSEKSLEKLSKYENISVIYKTNELGTFEGIENWQELSVMITDIFDEVLLSEKDKVKRNQLEMKMKPIMMGYQTKVGIEQILFKELQSFHSPLGLQLDSTEPLIYEQELPNLLSEGFIKGDGKIIFEEVNRADGYCVFTQKLKLNPEETKKMLVAVFKKMKLSEEEFIKEMEKSTVAINDNIRFEYFYYPGLPSNITAIREIIMELKGEKVKKIEKSIIELVYE